MTSNEPSVPSPMPHGGPLAQSCKRACPRCNSAVFGVSRRFVDLLISIVVPVRRYRCISMKCNWEGRLKQKKTFDRQAPIRLAAVADCQAEIVVLERWRIRRSTTLAKQQ